MSTRRRSSAKTSLGSHDADLASIYVKEKDRLAALGSEVKFTLERALIESGIKIHDVEFRVKELESITKKIADKQLEQNLFSISDLVGARVVCLFRSDMDRAAQIISNCFEVISTDDKTVGDPEVFGYFSIHYICQIKDAHTGPRYDWLKGISFEIQLRTLCMHAWSVVSHYLDYKGDWDVPQELRRSLSALSGLFWVADSQFESVYKERDQSIISAQQGAKSGSLLDDVINLDTLTAFLGEKYPDRDLSGDTVSALVSELKEAGFNTLGELDAVLDKSRDAFEHYEFTNPPTGDGRFAAVGVVRISLTIASEGYRRVRERLFPGSTNREPYAAARAMLKSDT